MLTVHLASDLHIDFRDVSLPGGEVLILAGDVMEARELKKQNYLTEWKPGPGKMDEGLRADRYHRFLKEECSKYEHVFYVAGNHEHYGSKLHYTHKYMRDNVPNNVHVLENESYELNGVLFIGATFWTDFNKGDYLTLMSAQHSMNDYSKITMKNPVHESYHKLRPKYVLNMHLASKRYFKDQLEKNRQGKNLPVVVITHHAPSAMSIPSWFKDNFIKNGYYYSDQSEFILDYPEIKFWCHGHTHERFEYEIGETRVICNPRGYYGCEQIVHEFDATRGFVIEGKTESTV